MRDWFRQLFLLTVVSSLILTVAARPPAEKRWWKGNAHAHTLWSDGDAIREWAADWYKSHGYHKNDVETAWVQPVVVRRSK